MPLIIKKRHPLQLLLPLRPVQIKNKVGVVLALRPMGKGCSCNKRCLSSAANGAPEATSGPLRKVTFFAYWVPVGLWMGFIFFVSSIPGRDVPSVFPFQDIFFHMCAYVFLAWLCKRALRRSFPKATSLALFVCAIVMSATYGLTDELHQIFVAGRHCDIKDLGTDLVGSIIGGLLLR